MVEGWYVVIDNAVVLTDAAGKPINGEKHHLAPGQDAHLLACRLIRQRRTGFTIRNWFTEIAAMSRLLIHRGTRGVSLRPSCSASHPFCAGYPENGAERRGPRRA